MERIIGDEEVAGLSRAVIDTISELDSGDESLQTSNGAQSAYLLGWWKAINRQAQGVLILVSAGLAYETAPLLRGMVEHETIILIVARDPDAWRITERSRAAKLRQFEEWLERYGYSSWGGLTATRENLSRPSPSDDPSSDHLAAFAHQCQLLGRSGDIHYARYQFLTHHSHASIESAMTFVSLPGCTCATCQGESPLDAPTPQALAACILLEVAAVYNDLLPSRPWTDVITEMEALVEPIRVSFGGAPLHVDRPAPL